MTHVKKIGKAENNWQKLNKRTNENQSIEKIQMTQEMLAIENRCNQLRSLKKGWHNGEGESINENQVMMAKNFIIVCLEQDYPFPIFGPDLDGNIEIEWQDKLLTVILNKNLRFHLESEFEDIIDLCLEDSIKELKKYFQWILKNNFKGWWPNAYYVK